MAAFSIKIHDSPPGRSASQFFRTDFQFLATLLVFPFIILFVGGVSGWIMIASVVIGWGGAAWFASRLQPGSGGRPVFEADRMGFRIKGGRLRPWETFLGAHIESHHMHHQEVKSFRIQVEGQSFDRATRVGTYPDYSAADRAVQKILAFQRRIEEIREREAANFALGPAPVVAARAERFVEVSLWRRFGRMLGRMLGRMMRG